MKKFIIICAWGLFWPAILPIWLLRKFSKEFCWLYGCLALFVLLALLINHSGSSVIGALLIISIFGSLLYLLDYLVSGLDKKTIHLSSDVEQATKISLPERDIETPTTKTTIRVPKPEVTTRVSSPPTFKTSLVYKLNEIDIMDGIEFEYYIANLLTSRGYQTQVTPASGDFGIDVIATNREGVKFGVQVKRYSGSVSLNAVSEAVAGALHWGCQRSMVITNSYFTSSARELAQSNGCELVDKNILKRWIIDTSRTLSSSASKR